MNRISALFIAIVLIFALCACDSGKVEDNTESTISNISAQESSMTAASHTTENTTSNTESVEAASAPAVRPVFTDEEVENAFERLSGANNYARYYTMDSSPSNQGVFVADKSTLPLSFVVELIFRYNQNLFSDYVDGENSIDLEELTNAAENLLDYKYDFTALPADTYIHYDSNSNKVYRGGIAGGWPDQPNEEYVFIYCAASATDIACVYLEFRTNIQYESDDDWGYSISAYDVDHTATIWLQKTMSGWKFLDYKKN